MFGDGKFSHNKGSRPAPTVRFRKEFEHQHIVIYVPEWMTSHTCMRCNSHFPKTIKDAAAKNNDGDVVWSTCYVRCLLFLMPGDCKCAPYQDHDPVGDTNILVIGTTTEENLPEIL